MEEKGNWKSRVREIFALLVQYYNIITYMHMMWRRKYKKSEHIISEAAASPVVY
jgi:hypothetical protein